MDKQEHSAPGTWVIPYARNIFNPVSIIHMKLKRKSQNFVAMFKICQFALDLDQ